MRLKTSTTEVCSHVSAVKATEDELKLVCCLGKDENAIALATMMQNGSLLLFKVNVKKLIIIQSVWR